MKFKKVKLNKVVEAGGWYTLSNFFVRGMEFLTIPVFTRLLTTEEYGIVSLYYTWVALFTIILSLNLVVNVGRGKYDFKDDYDNFLASLTFLSFLLFLFYLIIFIIFNGFFLEITNLTKLLFFLMVFQAYFSFIRQFTLLKLKFDYKYKTASVINILFSLLGLFLSIFFIINFFEENKYLGQILGSWIVIILLGVFCAVYLLLKRGKLFSWRYWKYGLSLSIPLILHNLSNIANAQFDRIAINKYIGDAETGIYSFAYNIGMIVSVLMISLNEAWVPWMYEKLNNNQFSILLERAKIYRNIFSLLFTLILFISPELIKIMASEEYWAGLYIIPWIFMAYYFQFMYIFEVNVEFFYKKTGLISLGTISSALINIILNIIFVPQYGFIAAAITTVISFFLLFLFHYIITNKIIKVNVFGAKFHFISIIQGSLIIIVFFLIENLVIIRYLLIFSLIFIGFIYFKKILNNKLLE
ncbi:lipopolysaccharide biosynthesis protein [Planococcus sp. Urea-3u-39]|uniref:lipopolysaccharide biosynthesis protein n=1 Tax=Planococcus sp. Urea-3u-39 TaxID=2058328 RepID=UPI0015E11DAB|nr:oligosaccharide flippase family protein [Planococcus sp. Urea-3u-39]